MRFTLNDVKLLEAKEDVEFLIRVLEYGGNKSVRAKAAEALGKLRNEEAVEPLVHALCYAEKEIRLKAAWALGEIGDEFAIEHLIQAFMDEEEDVREMSVKSIVKIGIGACLKTNHLSDSLSINPSPIYVV